MEYNNTAAKLQNLIQKRGVNQIGTLKRRDGMYTGIPKETLEELLHTPFPDDTEYTKYQFKQNLRSLDEKQIRDIANKMTIAAAMKEFKPYKSPEDGIFPI